MGIVQENSKEAVGVARQRCWRYDWVLDLDIKGFFDSIDHELLMRAVRKHTDCKWVLLYIERWMKTPVQLEDGSLVQVRATFMPDVAQAVNRYPLDLSRSLISPRF